jgi:hypothetical protein
MSFLDKILRPDILPFVVAIVAIVFAITAGAITTVTRLIIAHRERMAKIERGIDPDVSTNSAADAKERPPQGPGSIQVIQRIRE